jgi:DNA polymerase-3 subunit delta'
MLKKPLKNPIDALNLAKIIAKDLDSTTQLWLIDYLQQFYWQKQPEKTYLEALEKARQALLSYVQPRLVWECTLLQLQQ